VTEDSYQIETPPEGILVVQAVHRIPMSQFDWGAFLNPADESTREKLFRRIWKAGEDTEFFLRDHDDTCYRHVRLFFVDCKEKSNDLDASFRWAPTKTPERAA